MTKSKDLEELQVIWVLITFGLIISIATEHILGILGVCMFGFLVMFWEYLENRK